MERFRGVRKRRGRPPATNVAKRHAPRQGPSPRPELYDIEPATSAMASSTIDPPHTFLQVVDDVIDLSLIDNAVKTLRSESAREGISTDLQWTDACDALWRTYVGHVHSNVCPSSNGEFGVAYSLHRSSIAQRLPPLSNPTQRRTARSTRSYVSTQCFRNFLAAASLFRPTTTLSFHSFWRGSHYGRSISLQKNARRCHGRRGPWSVSKVEQP